MSPQVWVVVVVVVVRQHEAAKCPPVLWRADTFFIVLFNLRILNRFQVEVLMQNLFFLQSLNSLPEKKCCDVVGEHLCNPPVSLENYSRVCVP